METRYNIFLVEDDINFGSVLKSYLEMNNFMVTWANDGSVAIERFMQGNFSLCILDIMLPHIDGFSLAQKIKEINSSIPIVFLTAKTLKGDVLKGYQTGADDYITKPFDSDVLLCKINAILKRASSQSLGNKTFSVGNYLFNPVHRTLCLGGNTVKLSPKESGLLEVLCLHQNKVLERGKALKMIWGNEGYFNGRSMDVFITKLRKYLKDDPTVEIENIHGTGFILRKHQTGL